MPLPNLIAMPAETTTTTPAATLDTKTDRRVAKYAARVGINPTYFLSKIANEWLDDKGEYYAGRMAALAAVDTTATPAA
jgi:hypothetical protein